jgi:hypothetical protein
MAECRARNADKYEVQKQGADAYRNALPDLAGYENIRDFVACISHGLLTGDISLIHSPQFLYAAQVAISALRLAPKEKKKPEHDLPPLPWPGVIKLLPRK